MTDKSIEERLAHIEERQDREEAALCELDARSQVLPGKFGWQTKQRHALNELQQERIGREAAKE